MPRERTSETLWLFHKLSENGGFYFMKFQDDTIGRGKSRY